MFATRALRQAVAHAERVPSIKFIGKRSIPGTSYSLALTSSPLNFTHFAAACKVPKDLPLAIATFADHLPSRR